MMSQLIISARTLLALIIFLLVVTPSIQAQSPVSKVTILHVEAMAKEDGQVKVSVIVSVHDAEGNPVPGLRNGDFVLLEDDTQIENDRLTVGRVSHPLNVALLIDTSNNMADKDASGVRAIDRAKDAATKFFELETLKEGDQVAIFEYNSQLVVSQDFTYDHNQAIDLGIGGLDVREAKESCLYDALLKVIEALWEVQTGQGVAVVITGNPNTITAGVCGGATSGDLINAATVANSKIPFFIVSFGKDINKDELSFLVEPTGGQSLVSSDTTELTELLTIVSGQIKEQYELSYPTKVKSDAPVTIIVREKSSQKSDRRQVLIPAAIEPTPTPLPNFSISLNTKHLENKLTIEVEMTPVDISLAKMELYINNELKQKTVSPPFELAEIDLLDLGSGTYNIRVEVTDKNERVISATTQLTLEIPPTSVPATSLTPQPTITLDQVAPSNITLDLDTKTMVPVVLIIIGVVIFLVVLVLVAYNFFSRNKKQKYNYSHTSTGSASSTLSMITTDVGDHEPDNDKTTDEGDNNKISTFNAKLVVIEGHNIVSEQEFVLEQPEITIGRNSLAMGIHNDIPIDDKTVSRSHAKITFQGGKFIFQDQNSTAGTVINGKKIVAFEDVMLQNKDEITIGPKIKFRFELIDSGKTEDVSQDVTEDPDVDETLANYRLEEN